MPDIRPSLLAAAACLATIALAALPLAERPPSADVLGWWHTVGTGDAVATILRSIAVALSGYVTVVATLIALAGRLRCPSLHRLGVSLAPSPWRRRLTISAAAVALAIPAVASAQEAPIVMIDVGPVDPGATSAPHPAGPLLLHDLGPVAHAPPPMLSPEPHDGLTREGFRPAPAGPRAADSWLVERGDHLWAIAEQLVHRDDPQAGDVEVIDYWTRLIDANRGTLGDDPDLIHPGQVLVLPDR